MLARRCSQIRRRPAIQPRPSNRVRSFSTPSAAKLKLLRDAPPLQIVYEDNDFLFVNKPAGMASTGTDDTELCLHDIVKEHCFKRYNYRPSLLHRLDRVCSGLMVFGKHKPAEQYYQNLQQGLKGEDSDSLVKGYLAIVKGKPKRSRGTIKGGIIRTVSNPKRFSIVRRGGKPVETEYAVYNHFDIPSVGKVTSLCMRIVTGRRHQARASCSALGTPIVGDELYGGGVYNCDESKRSTTLLHSCFVSFPKMTRIHIYKIFLMPTWPNEVMEHLHAESLDETFDAHFVSRTARGNVQ